jgi:hypothetical protein
MSLLGIIASSRPSVQLPPVAGYTLWLDAADTSTITSSGGDVSQWNDKSGNARNFTQSSATAKPKTGTRTINSLNTIDFDGTNDFLSCPSSTALFNYLHSSTGATLFFVGIVDNTADTKCYLDNVEGNSGFIGVRLDINATEKDLVRVNKGVSNQNVISNNDVVTFTAGSAFYTSIKLDNNNGTAANRYKISLNGASELGTNAATASPVATNATNNLHLGILSDGTSIPYNGCFGEILFYSGILSAGDITATQSYLATKWGI